ncbi:MAG: hypothetical protein ACRD0J_01220 [Acidimicrobiales bacterium]
MLGLTATDQAKASLRRLRDGGGNASRAAYAAIGERIGLIRADPEEPSARGLVRLMPASGVLVRVAVVPVPGFGETWVVVWTLGQDAIELRLVEPYEG